MNGSQNPPWGVAPAGLEAKPRTKDLFSLQMKAGKQALSCLFLKKKKNTNSSCHFLSFWLDQNLCSFLFLKTSGLEAVVMAFWGQRRKWEGSTSIYLKPYRPFNQTESGTMQSWAPNLWLRDSTSSLLGEQSRKHRSSNTTEARSGSLETSLSDIPLLIIKHCIYLKVRATEKE